MKKNESWKEFALGLEQVNFWVNDFTWSDDNDVLPPIWLGQEVFLGDSPVGIVTSVKCNSDGWIFEVEGPSPKEFE